jgi:OOP family OmpA-OmpF porin
MLRANAKRACGRVFGEDRRSRENIVRKHAGFLVAFVCAGAMLAGCHTTVTPSVSAPVMPSGHERVVPEHVLIIADASGSMYLPEKFPLEKELLRSFVIGMPEGNYQAGLLAFGSNWSERWHKYPPERFDRESLLGAVAGLEWIGGATPMDAVFERLEPGLTQLEGDLAIVVLSDGKACTPATLDAATRIVTGYPGNLCIHTVQFGDDQAGGAMLDTLSKISGCGTFRHANDLLNADGMAQLIRDVFLGSGMGVVMGETAVSAAGVIYFDFDRATLRADAMPVIEDTVTILSERPALNVRIEGHTDIIGTDNYNEDLSQQRANAVAEALASRGIDRGRIETAAFGESQPAAPNDTRENRQLNRRAVVIYIH